MIQTEQTIRERCEALGLKAYDTALPQPWVDAMRARGHDVLGHVVWSYDGPNVMGEPFGVTSDGERMIAEDGVLARLDAGKPRCQRCGEGPALSGSAKCEACLRSDLAPEPAGPEASGVCDSCFMAFEDEGCDGDMLALGGLELGADIADHCCDETETDGETGPCSCPCGGTFKRNRRAAERKARKLERASGRRERAHVERAEHGEAHGVAGGSAAPAARHGEDQVPLSMQVLTAHDDYGEAESYEDLAGDLR